MTGARLAACALLVSFLSSCSLVVEPEVEKLGTPPRTCTPNEEAICACLGGLQGIQVCNEGGSFEPCNCGAAGAGG